MGKVVSLKELEELIKEAKRCGVDGACVICMTPAVLGKKCYCDYED